MYNLYLNEDLYGTYNCLKDLRDEIKQQNLEGQLRITYVYEDEETDEQYEENYTETLTSINVSGNNDYVELIFVGVEKEIINNYRIEIKDLEKLGMETLYVKLEEIKNELKDLYYEYNGFIPSDIVKDLVIEKFN